MTSDADDDGASRSPSPDDSDLDGGDMAQHLEHDAKAENQSQVNNGQAKPLNAKDPQRPRRKKARRACFACQRAHLTCGEYFVHVTSSKSRNTRAIRPIY